MKPIGISAFVVAIVLSQQADAQAVESHVTASNGVVVDVNSDEFANRYEYSAPIIKFSVGSGAVESFALVAKVKKSGALSGLMIQGNIYYNGEWHYYTSALFKGGDPVDFAEGSKEVLNCSYGCSFTEGFVIKLKPTDIAKHAENGTLAVQIRPARSTEIALLQIPVSYINAVNEVAK